MGRLRDPRHEMVAREMALGKSAVEACEIAGYPAGSSFGPNARKRAQRLDIKARIAELQAPIEAWAKQANAVTRERLLCGLHRIIDLNIDDKDIRVSDQLVAIRIAAQIIGALAPDRHEHRFVPHEDALDELDERPREGAEARAAG